jgi:hypothetical protein
MANIFFLNKKKAFRFFNILFISYNNFIINYKTVHIVLYIIMQTITLYLMPIMI